MQKWMIERENKEQVMANKNDPPKAELNFGNDSYVGRRIEERLREVSAKLKALKERGKEQRKKKSRVVRNEPPSLFDDLSLFGGPDDKNRSGGSTANGEKEKAERAKIRAEKAREKREKVARNTEATIAAFEAGNWNAGYKLAGNADWYDPRIQYWLGRFYEEGFMLERDPEGSVEFYRNAAEHGHEDAKRRLDRMHIEGFGASFPVEAEWVSWKRCREAAERGDAEAQAIWGTILFFDGKCVEAREWQRSKTVRGHYIALEEHLNQDV